MNLILTVLLWGLLGATLASANIYVYMWQFWVVNGICFGITVLAYRRGINA